MKCHPIFWGNKKNIGKLTSAEFVHSTVFGRLEFLSYFPTS